MRKLLYFIGILLGVGCTSTSSEREPFIEKICSEFASDTITAEEAAHWDSMNANGGYLLLRGAERDLDTIVNHIHLKFRTEE